MQRCNKCNGRLTSQLWIVDGITYCSPFCERSSWDNKQRKWTTRFHKHGDYNVKKYGLAGLKKQKKSMPDWS